MYKKFRLKITPTEFFQKLNEEEKNVCFQMSFSDKGWLPLISFNPTETYQSENKYKKFIQNQQAQERLITGYFSYDIAYQLYDIKQNAIDDLKLPKVYLQSHSHYIIFDPDNQWGTIHYHSEKDLDLYKKIAQRKPVQNESNYKNNNFKAIISPEEYQKAYKKIKSYIRSGDIYQINLTHRLEAKTNMPARLLFQKVIESNQVDFLAYLENKNFQILSASPERFIKIKDRKITTEPIKGTRPRGQNKAEDEKLLADLIASEKEKAELHMITDLLRNDIGKIAQIGSVEVVARREIKKLEAVWHTYSKITGNVKPALTTSEALISMLPGGSITGCPKKRAIEIIDELEKNTRSVYTGVIGRIEPNGDLDFNIAIRTIIKKDQKLYLQVGGGIVLDSLEEAEFEETLDKVKSFMKILC